jgi:hypothetical protein
MRVKPVPRSSPMRSDGIVEGEYREPSCSSSVRGCVWTGICNDAVMYVAACDLTVVTVEGVMVMG